MMTSDCLISMEGLTHEQENTPRFFVEDAMVHYLDILQKSEIVKGQKMSNDERQLLSDRIRQNEQFDVQLMFLDKRPSVIHCRPCSLVFQNAYRRRQHDKDKHGGKRAEEATGESLCQELVNKIAENQITNTSNMTNILEKIATAVVGISKKEDETIPRTTQITKAKPPPSWVGQDYERFEKEVKNWEANNKDPPETKYRDFLESLKKEPKVSSWRS